MEQPYPREAEPAQRIRRGYWTLLAVALLLALAIPAILLCRANFAPLAVRAYLTPAAPQVGQTARLVVTLASATDRDATDGPWAQATVAWDMQTMTMGTHALAVAGSARTPGVFSVALVPAMAGAWYARIALQTPGRPVWRGVVQFTVLPPRGAGLSTATFDLAPPITSRASGSSQCGAITLGGTEQT